MKIYDALQSRARPGAPPPAPPPTSGRGVREVRFGREELAGVYQMADAQLPDGAPKVLQMMSATAGEGASTVARELGYAVADATGRRVLLLRIESGRKRAARQNQPGLDAVLRGDIEIEQAVSRVGALPLFTAQLSSAGQASHDLFGSARLGELFDRLLGLVDVVVH